LSDEKQVPSSPSTGMLSYFSDSFQTTPLEDGVLLTKEVLQIFFHLSP